MSLLPFIELNSGLITPTAARLLIALKIAKKITSSPTDLKKTPSYSFVLTATDVKLNSPSTGSVPRAKKSIVRAPVMALPVDTA